MFISQRSTLRRNHQQNAYSEMVVRYHLRPHDRPNFSRNPEYPPSYVSCQIRSNTAMNRQTGQQRYSHIQDQDYEDEDGDELFKRRSRRSFAYDSKSYTPYSQSSEPFSVRLLRSNILPVPTSSEARQVKRMDFLFPQTT